MSQAPAVLMVCLGNICRSPMAEGLLRHRAAEKGITLNLDSAGTSGFHRGNPPDERMMETAKAKGIDISYIRSRVFTNSDFDQFDQILVMDKSNLRNVLKLARNDNDAQKVQLIMNYVYPNENIEVPDPYFGSENGFLNVFNMLDDACQQILNMLNK